MRDRAATGGQVAAVMRTLRRAFLVWNDATGAC
jgi:hypothetical protein